METLKEATKKKLVASEKKALIILFFLSPASLFFESKKMIFLGILIGGGLSLANIMMLSKMGEKVFQQTGPRKTTVVIIYIIKMIILFGVLFFLMRYKVVNIFAFIVGFSIILLIVGWEIVFPPQKPTNY